MSTPTVFVGAASRGSTYTLLIHGTCREIELQNVSRMVLLHAKLMAPDEAVIPLVNLEEVLPCL